MNVDYKGVYRTKNDKFMARIKINQKAVHLGVFVYEEEAYFARWYAERIIFKDFAFPKDEPEILESRKEDIKKLVEQKVQRL